MHFCTFLAVDRSDAHLMQWIFAVPDPNNNELRAGALPVPGLAEKGLVATAVIRDCGKFA
jgi:hypothetical protein